MCCLKKLMKALSLENSSAAAIRLLMGFAFGQQLHGLQQSLLLAPGPDSSCRSPFHEDATYGLVTGTHLSASRLSQGLVLPHFYLLQPGRQARI